MCGSATLAMVVSSTCITVASMMAAVSRPLFLTTTAGGVSAASAMAD